MESFRLLADDLTGALDTAVEFVGLCGPFDVSWAGALPPQLPSSLAIDTGTRELDKSRGLAIIEGLVPLLRDDTIGLCLSGATEYAERAGRAGAPPA
jgi:hypothetical protein